MELKQMKKEMRSEIRTKIASLTEDTTQKSNKLILNNLLSLDEIEKAETIFCFVGTNKEIDTVPFIEMMLQKHKRIAVPLCVEKGIMEARQITEISELKPGKYGILEPENNSILITKEKIDAAVIPCITCDRQCNRLGQGGGYYDRFLDADFHKIAICREILLVHKVPVEEFDQPVDMLVTENKIYKR